jgi:hypothetical protein
MRSLRQTASRREILAIGISSVVLLGIMLLLAYLAKTGF